MIREFSIDNRSLKAGVILIILFFLLLYSSISLWDPDFWWHINTGRYIIEHRALPDEDPFSFTEPGQDETRNSLILKGYWLAQILLYEVYNLGAVHGVILFRTFFLTLTLLLVWRFMRKGEPILGLANLLLVGNTLFYFTGERPQTLTFPLAVLMFMVIQGYLEGGKGKALFFLPLITLIWTNLHGSVLFAAAVIVTYAISAPFFLKDISSGRKTVFAGACILSLLAVFLSPSRETLITGFLDFQTGIIKSESVEFFSPFKLLASYGKFYPSYWISMLAVAFLLLTNIRSVPVSTTLILALSSALSLTGARYMVFYVLATPLLFRLPHIRMRKIAQAAVLLAALVPVIMNLGYFKPFNFSIRETYPAESLKLLHHKSPERIFAYLEWGGFIGFHLPEAKVFIDGRMLNEDTLVRYNAILQGTEAMGQKEWKRNLEKYNVDAIVLPLRDFNTGRPIPLIGRLSEARDWELVFYNEREILFMRKQRQPSVNEGAAY